VVKVEQFGVNSRTARVAGFLYLIVVIAGILSLAYLPGQVIDRSDAQGTFANLQAHGTLLRVAVVCGLVCYTAFLLLPLVLYALLGHVSKPAAVLMVAFAAASVPIGFANELNRLEALTLVSGAGPLQGISQDSLPAVVLLSLSAYSNGLLVQSVFWGLWLLPFGYLVFRSGLLPKILGVLLVLGCFGYLIDFIGKMLWPHYTETFLSGVVRLPATIGEIGTCLWLLILGIRDPA
jgi:hypothetical protein